MGEGVRERRGELRITNYELRFERWGDGGKGWMGE